MHMRSVVPMRTAKIGYIVISAAMCVLGILLMALPDFSASVLGVIFGIMMTVFGAVRLTGYFSKDLYRLAFQYDLPFGILLIVLGIIMLIKPDRLLMFSSIAIGLFTLTDGLFKIQIAIDSRRFGISAWWLILLLAVISAGMGLVLTFRPGEGSRVIMILLGLALMSEGLLNIGTMITAVKIVHHQHPDVIEADYTDLGEE